MNLYVQEEKYLCCGCSLCVMLCPVGAIEMVKDKFGFLYAKIQKEKCISCGKCKRECTFSKNKRGEKYD